MEQRQMTENDFVEVMNANSEIYPEFAKLTEDQKKYLANVNICTGTANSYIENDKVVGVGGTRYIGLGEIWCVVPPEIREKRKFSLLKEAKKTFDNDKDSLNLWRIFADAKISENFIEHLGFKKSNSLIWTRQ